MKALDAIVVGAGPNGLAAAITLARAGRTVTVYEAADRAGGGCRSEALTLPGFVHDVCSAVHPMALASPFFQTLPLADHGLEWIEPRTMLGHPFDDGTPPALLVRSLAETADGLGPDRQAYGRVIGATLAAWPTIGRAVLGDLRVADDPVALAAFGWRAVQSAQRLARSFGSARARALLAGIAAHSMLPLDRHLSGGVALVLGTAAHAVGWPFARGGSQTLADALASYLRSLGGEIATGTRVTSLDELPRARAILCDLSPRPFAAIARGVLPERYRRSLGRYRYGMGVYKVDWALGGPIPWRDGALGTAGTVHLGGTLEEIALAERAAWRGHVPDRPFVLLAQPTVADPSRAPAGRHVAWAYCHVPHGCTADMLPRIEAQIERFAPGFRDRVLARHVLTPADLERRNPNLVGGDIAMGVMDVRQWLARPTWRRHRTPRRGLFICSAASPPGVGVHGMCGYLAALAALRDRTIW